LASAVCFRFGGGPVGGAADWDAGDDCDGVTEAVEPAPWFLARETTFSATTTTLVIASTATPAMIQT
jgi:hypothetical protein